MNERRFEITWGERGFTLVGIPRPWLPEVGVWVIAYHQITCVRRVSDGGTDSVWITAGSSGLDLDAHSASEAGDIVAELARRMGASL